MKVQLVPGTSRVVLDVTSPGADNEPWARGLIYSGEWAPAALGWDLPAGTNYTAIVETIDPQSLDTVQVYSVQRFTDLDDARRFCLSHLEELCKALESPERN